MLKTAYMKKYLKYGIMGILAAIVSFLFLKPEKKEVKSTIRSYEEIIQSGVLRAITEYNAFSFHAQEDTVSGFHYELIQAFAKSKNLKVDIIPEMSLEKRIQGVESAFCFPPQNFSMRQYHQRNLPPLLQQQLCRFSRE